MKVTEKAGESIGLHVNASPAIRQGKRIREGKSKKVKGKKGSGSSFLPFTFSFCLTGLQNYPAIPCPAGQALAIQKLK
jgi:hypothetical protein